MRRDLPQSVFEKSGSYLIDQWREKIIIVFVDQRDVKIRIIFQFECEIDTTETAAYDHQSFGNLPLNLRIGHTAKLRNHLRE